GLHARPHHAIAAVGGGAGLAGAVDAGIVRVSVAVIALLARFDDAVAAGGAAACSAGARDRGAGAGRLCAPTRAVVVALDDHDRSPARPEDDGRVGKKAAHAPSISPPCARSEEIVGAP